MKIQLAMTPIGKGPRLFHITVYGSAGGHGRMLTVASISLARALYSAWCVIESPDTPFDLSRCDGYLIGEVSECMT